MYKLIYTFIHLYIYTFIHLYIYIVTIYKYLSLSEFTRLNHSSFLNWSTSVN